MQNYNFVNLKFRVNLTTLGTMFKKFPNLSKMLKASLTFFHGTASVEGAVNTTRNTLGERRHRLIDGNLNARKMMKDAVKVSDSECCYDFDLLTKPFLANWRCAWKDVVKVQDSASNDRDHVKNEDKVKVEEIDSEKPTKLRRGLKNEEIWRKRAGDLSEEQIGKNKKTKVEESEKKASEKITITANVVSAI